MSPPPIDLVLEAERDVNAIHHRLDACLASERPVLLGLALLAERVVDMLEDMFRMAAQSAQTVDKASDFV
ncbi:hypothetical protein F4823DRAFT_561340 [Ustulina deusta]|nr:hypothetical protein F4823DRAFT_561340 [Ustulina deusta]